MSDHSGDTGRFTRRTFNRAVGGAAAGAALTAAAGEANADRDDDGRRGRGRDERTPALVAHRGYAGTYPQNTLLAVEAASRDPRTDVIEIDVLQTAEGTVVVFHDERLDDLTDAEGPVHERSDDAVLSAEVLDSGETIPTLTQVMDAISPSVGVNVEFKSYRPPESSSANPWLASGLTRRTLGILDDHPHEVLISSFDARALEAVREVDPSVPTAFLVTDADENPVAAAGELGCDALHPGWPMTDSDLVDRAHEAGIAVNCWTIRNWKQTEAVRSLGVDGLIADYPSALAFARARQRGDGGDEGDRNDDGDDRGHGDESDD